ncbi:MAG: polysaccharide biosynthesis tyrosine autokinase [Thermoguttaceae bacterium]|nr:polysaccharide biosynthesis tyrosine autokinase [Thermoguttaceae bacterium]MDW8038871.1 polysaccharide biosynthesis tyrosine autokinase [Thermoguttaceae bacterium]
MSDSYLEGNGGAEGNRALVPSGRILARESLQPISPPEILRSTPRPMDFVYALRRQWGWALGLGIIAAGLAATLAWFLIPVNYTATAWLRIASSKPSIMFKVGGEDELLNDRRAVATLMTSRFVLSAALKKPGVSQCEYIKQEDDPLTWLRENIQVSFPGNSEILQIALTGDDPSQLVTIVNAVKDAYMEEVVGVDRENQLRRKQVLEQSYHRNLAEIKRKTTQYEQLANELGAPDSEAMRLKSLYALETTNTLRDRITRLQQAISGIDQRIAIGEAMLKKMGEETVPDETKQRETLKRKMMEAALAQDPWISYAQQQIALLDIRIFEERQRVVDEKAPSIARMRERQQKYREGIEKRIAEITPTLEKQIEERIREHLAEGWNTAPKTPREQQLASLEAWKTEKAVLEKELQIAQEAFNKHVEETQKFSSQSIDLELRKSELERLKRLTERMGQELEQWEVELAAAPRVTVLEPASVPKTSDIKRKYRMMWFLSAAAFGLAVLAVAGVDFLSRRVNSSAEVAYGLGLRVVGDVPTISGRHRWQLALDGRGSPLHGLLADSIDNIRTALLYQASMEGIKVTLITSALAREGKTTVATQLAASLGRTGRFTLLIDGDLRRPSAHRVFDLPQAPGLCEVLRNEAQLEDVIRPTRVPGVWLLPAGRWDINAIQALVHDELREQFAKLRESFDFILIDAGPVLTDSDALLLGRYADGVLLSVLRDVSRVPYVYEACQRIRAVNIPLLGAVVNGVGTRRYRSYYYYRSYYPRPEENTASSV